MNYLNNLITRELEEWDISSIASHEIAVQNAQYTLVGNNEEIILLSLKLQNDWLKTDSQIMVRLVEVC